MGKTQKIMALSNITEYETREFGGQNQPLPLTSLLCNPHETLVNDVFH